MPGVIWSRIITIQELVGFIVAKDDSTTVWNLVELRGYRRDKTLVVLTTRVYG